MKRKPQVVVVTGGGSGIGAGIAKAFAREKARVALLDIQLAGAEKVATGIRRAGGQAIAWQADVTSRKDLEAVANDLTRQWGAPDVWVNSAGVSYVMPFLDCSEEIWDRTLDINLKGTFLGCQTALKRMVPRHRGVIINLSSQSGKAGNSHYAAYCASKFGVIGLTQSLAVEFAATGLRINALCPGVVFTPLWDTMKAGYAAKRGLAPDEVRAHLEAKVPMKRLCRVEDVANAALFLASDAAAYITGQAINLTGGLVMH